MFCSLFSFGQQTEENPGILKRAFSFGDQDSLSLFMISKGCFHTEQEDLLFIRRDSSVILNHKHFHKIEQLEISLSFFKDSILPIIRQFRNFHKSDCGSTTTIEYVMYLNAKNVTIREKEWVVVDIDEQNQASCYVEDCSEARRLTTLYWYSQAHAKFPKKPSNSSSPPRHKVPSIKEEEGK
jgi:hypothetical protein